MHNIDKVVAHSVGTAAEGPLIGKELLPITGLCVTTLMYIAPDSSTIW